MKLAQFRFSQPYLPPVRRNVRHFPLIENAFLPLQLKAYKSWYYKSRVTSTRSHNTCFLRDEKMLVRTPDLFSIADLVQIDRAKNTSFRDQEQPELAGRCLLDVLEYLRAIPQFTGQFRQVTNAHTIR